MFLRKFLGFLLLVGILSTSFFLLTNKSNNNEGEIIDPSYEILENYTLAYEKAVQKHNAVVLSVCNTNRYHFCDFIKSSQSKGALLHVLKYGASRIINRDKIFIMNEAIQLYSNETIVVFADCLDVIFNHEFEAMIKLFKEKNTQIIMPVEHTCWPDDVILKLKPNADVYKWSCVEAYDMINSRNHCFRDGPRFINSGTYIGYAGALKKFLGSICNEIKEHNLKGTSDQKYFHETFLLGKTDMFLDYCVEFTLVMFHIEGSCYPHCPWVRSHPDYIEHIPTGTRPMFVHFNGVSKNTLYTKYVNTSMIVKEPRFKPDIPMFWVNGQPRRVSEYCPS